ncbi:choline kinase [Candidatus Tenderia electrophaga]|jgi:hypothetical protein|uniref:Choline kinase n=1 Tax=Candidatus Tenderia electrophaga TaxID=1748243 RepID=A0A0S2TH59_9GAMM|nr:choline kinase [Candidatus Tenderia electrophaga]
MNPHVQDLVLTASGAEAITSQDRIQTLWSGYGEILRLTLAGAAIGSVILKHIVVPDAIRHPRGWNSKRSHARKLHSYKVEMHWYRDWAERCHADCRVARCFAASAGAGEHIIVLEDLDAAGFPLRKSHLTLHEVQVCLKWLASFHARFLGETPSDLWPVGTYWHLATRPDEWAAMADGELKQAAELIDARLNQCQFQTLLHGDAKVANFCFAPDGGAVAAVDFQYVGGGCGMKDVAYFLGSCLSAAECARHQDRLLDYYFAQLQGACKQLDRAPDFSALEQEWRSLFPYAWTDFHRFLLGWAPDHWKVNAYSEQLAAQVLTELKC